MTSAWITHVKNVQMKNGISYKDALKMASKTYTKIQPVPKKMKSRL